MCLRLSARNHPRSKLLTDAASAPGHASPADVALNNRDFPTAALLLSAGDHRRYVEEWTQAVEHRVGYDEGQALMERLMVLLKSIPRMADLDDLTIRAACGKEFDASRFFGVFDKVRPQTGQVLDFFHSGIHGDRRFPPPHTFWGWEHEAPVVFTRPKSDPKAPRGIAVDRLRTLPQQARLKVEFDPTAEGYLQFAVFSLAVQQFYLNGRASEEDEQAVLCPVQLETIIKAIQGREYRGTGETSAVFEPSLDLGGGVNLPTGRRLPASGTGLSAQAARELRQMDLRPVIKVGGRIGDVEALTFRKWGGFSWSKFAIRWPNWVYQRQSRLVAAYDCGVSVPWGFA